jgi:hypothetical protein
MSEAQRIEVPKRKVTAIEWDTESDTVTVIWSDRSREEMIILELVFGPQGTWARLTPVNNPTYIVCVTQSATMPSETYIVHEAPEIPEQPLIVLPEEQTLSEVGESGTPPVTQEIVL